VFTAFVNYTEPSHIVCKLSVIKWTSLDTYWDVGTAKQARPPTKRTDKESGADLCRKKCCQGVSGRSRDSGTAQDKELD